MITTIQQIDPFEELARFSNDPLGFVLFCFPWGEPGPLENASIDPWQEEVLRAIGAGLLTLDEAIRIARTSGHGIGKSALVAWIILWAISTFEDTKGVVTANTETQLKTKTWAELAKWYDLFLFKEQFEFTATRLCIAAKGTEEQSKWKIDLVPWSERNTEAFAGLHNKGKRILLIMDEGSAIPDAIYEVAEGALTDENTQIIWCVFGNPTRNKGRFRECFDGGKFAHRWNHKTIDSRDVAITNKKLFQQWIDDYGVDSDFVRIRVRGIFPRVDAESFISFEAASAAALREVVYQSSEAVVLGVDVARFGDDASVIYPRQGLDAKSLPIEIYQGIDTVELATKVAVAFRNHRAVLVFVDSGGVGGGVVDQLNRLRIPVIPVDFGSRPDGINPNDGTKYANKRAEIWGAMRDWLTYGAIPDKVTQVTGSGRSITLADELIGPTYGLNGAEAILLESKKDMRRRGEPSPNAADALACTFAVPIPAFSVFPVNEEPTVAKDYNPFEEIFA